MMARGKGRGVGLGGGKQRGRGNGGKGVGGDEYICNGVDNIKKEEEMSTS